MGKKKIGRPTDNPKPYRVSVKCDEEARQTILSYCQQENVSMMEAARRGIKMLKGELTQQ